MGLDSKTPKRIAFLTGDLSPAGAGVKEVVERLSLELDQSGDEVRVFGLETVGWLDGGEMSWKGAPAQAYKTIGPSTFGYSPSMNQELRRFNPDLVHVHGIWQYPSLLALRWRRHGKGALVISPHGMFNKLALQQSKLKKYIARKLYVDALMRQADMLIASTNFEVIEIDSVMKSLPISVVANGITLPDKKLSHRKKVTTKNLLFLSRFHAGKNLIALLHAWQLLSDENKNSNWKLVIAGWGSEQEEAAVKTLVEKQKNQGINVELLGSVFGHEKAATFANASAFILPSAHEAFPVVLLEAWAEAIPVLMSKFCNINAAFDAGAAVPTGITSNEIAKALEQFFSLSDKQRQALAKKGFDFVKKNYSLSKVSNDMKHVYDSLLCVDELDVSSPTKIRIKQ